MVGLNERRRSQIREKSELSASLSLPLVVAQYPCPLVPAIWGKMQRLAIPNGATEGVRIGAKL